jgi:hypothetical protein
MGFLDNLRSRFSLREDTWKPVTFESHGFSVEMPSQPTMEVLQRPSFPSKIWPTGRLWCERSEGGTRFSVDIVELGFDPTIQEVSPGQLLRQMAPPREGAEVEATEMDGHPGYTSSLATAMRRCYLVGERIYLVSVEAKQGPLRAEEAERFFSAFRLVGAPLRRSRVQFLTLLLELPAGWQAGPLGKTPGVLLESAAAYPVRGLEKPDRFTVSVIGAGGHELDEMALQLIAETSDPQSLKRAGLGAAEIDHGPPERTEIGGVPAIIARGPSVLTVGGIELVYGGPRAFMVHNGILFIVAARYSVERAVEVGPVAEAFLAGLRFLEPSSDSG